MSSTQEIHSRRPTSPHLTIYRKQISSVLSISHRLSGMLLFAALSLISWWLIILQFSNFCECWLKLASCCIVKASLVAISYAGFFHICTGIRHLIWDTGRGFSICSINFTGWLAVIASAALTAIFWFYIV